MTELSRLVALGAAALVGVGVFFALDLAARPSQEQERLAAVEQQVAEAERLARRRPSVAQGKLGACAGGDPGALERLRQQVLAAGARHNVALSNVFSDVDGVPAKRWTNVTLSFSGNGQQADVIALLDALAAQRPTLFADSLDLVAGQGSVDFSFSGKVVCAA